MEALNIGFSSEVEKYEFVKYRNDEGRNGTA